MWILLDVDTHEVVKEHAGLSIQPEYEEVYHRHYPTFRLAWMVK